MKKIRYSSVLSGLLIVLLMISCKSAPKKSVEQTPEPAAPEIVEEIFQEETVQTEDLGSATFEQLGELLATAQAEREEIFENEFENKNPELFATYEDAYARAAKAYEDGPAAFNKKAYDDAVEAASGFRQILDVEWMAKIDGVRKASRNAQQEALKLKADVAVKANYNLAAEFLNKAESAYRTKEWKQAYEFFIEAEPMFNAVAALAAEKRRAADLALKNAEKKLAESEQIVADAEKILEERAKADDSRGAAL